MTGAPEAAIKQLTWMVKMQSITYSTQKDLINDASLCRNVFLRWSCISVFIALSTSSIWNTILSSPRPN